MTPEEQAIIGKAALKQATIKATIAAHKPKSRYRISVVATFLDAAGNDPAKLREYAITYLQQCGMVVTACDIEEVLP
jgi:glutaminase